MANSEQFLGSEKKYPKIGCILFDKPSLGVGSTAVACIFGDKSFRVKNSYGLDKSYIWISNIRKQEFNSMGASSVPWVRHSEFFETPLESILSEVGVLNQSRNIQAEIATSIFSRTMSRLTQFYDSCLPSGFGSTLCTTIRDRVIGNSFLTIEDDKDVQDAMVSAMSSIGSATSVEIGPRERLIRISAKRISHTIDSMRVTIPVGGWSLVQGFNPSVVELMQMAEPSLSLVSIKSSNKNLLNLLPKIRMVGPRLWVARPELQIIGNNAELDVEKVYVCDSFLNAANSFRKPLPKPIPSDYASISSGIAYESILGAAALPDSTTNNGEQSYGPRSAWIASEARARMLVESMTLSAAGVSVIDFGVSHITVSVSSKGVDNFNIGISKCTRLINPNI